MARNVVFPPPAHSARAGSIAPILAFGATMFQGPGARTVSSKLPVFVGTVATFALTPPLAAEVKFSVGFLSAARAAALLQNVGPLSVGQVTPTGGPFTTELAKLLVSCTAPAAHVATRWISGTCALTEEGLGVLLFRGSHERALISNAA